MCVSEKGRWPCPWSLHFPFVGRWIGTFIFFFTRQVHIALSSFPLFYLLSDSIWNDHANSSTHHYNYNQLNYRVIFDFWHACGKWDLLHINEMQWIMSSKQMYKLADSHVYNLQWPDTTKVRSNLILDNLCQLPK